MEKFQFVPSKIQGGGNEPMTLQEAMDKFQGKEEYSFDTYVLKGEKSFKQRSLQVPYWFVQRQTASTLPSTLTSTSMWTVDGNVDITCCNANNEVDVDVGIWF